MNKIFFNFLNKGYLQRIRILVLLVLLFSHISVYGQNTWSIGTSVQATQGKYIFENSTNTYYLYSNLRYYLDRLNFSVSVPLIAQTNDQITNIGGMFLPAGQMHEDTDNPQGGMMGNSGNMMGNSKKFSSLAWGIGDIYLLSSYQMLTEQLNRPALILTAQLKVPTADVEKNYGTGEYDYGVNLTIRKSVSQFIYIFDLGFLVLGDPEGFDYQDPLTFGAGLGTTFYQGQYSILLYYQGYTKIFSELPAPGQWSLGFLYKLNSSLTVSALGAAGVSETSPDFSILTGFEWSF